jgi:hypothetical protein
VAILFRVDGWFGDAVQADVGCRNGAVRPSFVGGIAVHVSWVSAVASVLFMLMSIAVRASFAIGCMIFQERRDDE